MTIVSFVEGEPQEASTSTQPVEEPIESPIGEDVPSEPRKVVIDKSHLNAAYDSCVSASADSTVDDLLLLHSVLKNLTQKHSKALNKSKLLSVSTWID